MTINLPGLDYRGFRTAARLVSYVDQLEFKTTDTIDNFSEVADL